MRQEVIELLAGNAEHAQRYRNRFEDVQAGQRPAAVTVSCSDARVLADHLWGNDEPGQLFTCTNIGNRVVQRPDDPIVSGDVLYPLVHAGTEIVVVVGHTGCGAVTAAYDELTSGTAEPEGIAHCLTILTADLAPGVGLLPPEASRKEAVNRLVEFNVDRQVERLVASDDVPAAVTCVGVVYDFHDVYPDERGEVHVINVDGETDPDALRGSHPAIASRVHRRWVP